MDPHTPVTEIPDTNFTLNDHPLRQCSGKYADGGNTDVKICT